MKNISKTILYTGILLTCGFLLSGCTPSKEKVAEYGQIVGEADVLIEGKEYSSAIEKLSKAAQLIPSKLDAYERIVNLLLLKNRLDDAKTLIDESASKLSDTDRGELYISIGKEYYNRREYVKALNCFELANVGFGDNETISLSTAKIYLQQGELEKAKNLLNRNWGEENLLEGKLLYSYVLGISDTSKAKETLEGIEPSDQWNLAYSDWKGVLDSLTEDVLFNAAKISKVYIDEGYPYLAIQTLLPLKEQMDEYVDGKYLLGKAYFENGKYQESLDTLVGVTSLSNLNTHLYWLIARDYYLLNDVNQSFSYYDSAISYSGDTPEIKLYQEYLDLLFENNQTTKAEEVLSKTAKIFDEPWVDLYYVQLSYMDKQDEKISYYMGKIEYEKLEGDYRKEYLYWKTKVSMENSNLDEAKRALDLYWEIDKYDPMYNLLMAQLKYQEGNLEESRTYAKKSIEYDTQRAVTDEAQKLLARID